VILPSSLKIFTRKYFRFLGYYHSASKLLSLIDDLDIYGYVLDISKKPNRWQSMGKNKSICNGKELQDELLGVVKGDLWLGKHINGY